MCRNKLLSVGGQQQANMAHAVGHPWVATGATSPVQHYPVEPVKEACPDQLLGDSRFVDTAI